MQGSSNPPPFDNLNQVLGKPIPTFFRMGEEITLDAGLNSINKHTNNIDMNQRIMYCSNTKYPLDRLLLVFSGPLLLITLIIKITQQVLPSNQTS